MPLFTLFRDANSFSYIVFAFNSTEFTFNEDSGTNSIPVSLSSGNLGDFTVILIGATTDSDTVHATGKKLSPLMKRTI